MSRKTNQPDRPARTGTRVQATFEDEPISALGRYVRAHPDELHADSVGYCQVCYLGNAFWRERCQRCGGPKPWLYPAEILGDDFEDL